MIAVIAYRVRARLRLGFRLPRVEWWPFVGAGCGFAWTGPVGAVLGAATALAVPVLLKRRRARERAAHLDEAMPGLLEEIAAAIAAGANLPVAISEARAPAPLDDALEIARATLRAGASLEDALGAFSNHAGTERATLVATALAIGHRTGGDLPRVLRALASSGRERAVLAREVRAATAQARLSAWVVAAMPLAFLVMLGAASREQTHVLFATPAGWVLLAAGCVLEAGGIAWMRRLS